MNSYKRYPSYKDSDNEWLGAIPDHWESLSNKYIFKICKDLVGKFSSNYTLLSLTLNGIIKRNMENPMGKFPAEYDTYQKVSKGDFVFCLFDVEETPRTVGLSEFHGMITGAYTVMKVKGSFSTKFLYYFYLNLDKKKRFKPLYRGLRNIVPKEKFMGYKAFIPPKPEQTAIANFLDKKTAEINQFIELKENTIKLLKERKTAIINQAVTKGLDPNVEMKDSGIEWLGEIPKHWEVVPLRYLGSNQNGISKDSDYFQSGYPFVSYGDVYKNRVLPSKVAGFAKSTKADQKTYSIEKGDVIFTRTSETIDEIGFASTCLTSIEKVVFSGFLIRFRPRKNRLSTQFSKYYFRSNIHRKFFIKEMNIVIRASLSQNLLNRLPVVQLPVNEQEQIGAYLDKRTNEFDLIISQAEKEITLIKEYQQSLISDAVTGKIDVRGEVVA